MSLSVKTVPAPWVLCRDIQDSGSHWMPGMHLSSTQGMSQLLIHSGRSTFTGGRGCHTIPGGKEGGHKCFSCTSLPFSARKCACPPAQPSLRSNRPPVPSGACSKCTPQLSQGQGPTVLRKEGPGGVRKNKKPQTNPISNLTTKQS